MEIFLTLLTATTALAAVDCSRCTPLADEINRLKNEKRSSQVELNTERANLKSLGAGKESKRMRLNAHLFVLAARIETAENLLLHKEKEYKLSCKPCK